MKRIPVGDSLFVWEKISPVRIWVFRLIYETGVFSHFYLFTQFLQISDCIPKRRVIY
jgi:hypothetical protein